MFDPVIGRFVSADPIEDCGLKTQRWNRYAYVGNRAVTLKDPSGLMSEWGFDDGLAVTSWGLAVGLDADEEIPVIGHIYTNPWVRIAGPYFLENWDEMLLREALVQTAQRMEELRYQQREREEREKQCQGTCVEVAKKVGRDAGTFAALTAAGCAAGGTCLAGAAAGLIVVEAGAAVEGTIAEGWLNQLTAVIASGGNPSAAPEAYMDDVIAGHLEMRSSLGDDAIRMTSGILAGGLAGAASGTARGGLTGAAVGGMVASAYTLGYYVGAIIAYDRCMTSCAAE